MGGGGGGTCCTTWPSEYGNEECSEAQAKAERPFRIVNFSFAFFMGRRKAIDVFREFS